MRIEAKTSTKSDQIIGDGVAPPAGHRDPLQKKQTQAYDAFSFLKQVYFLLNLPIFDSLRYRVL